MDNLREGQLSGFLIGPVIWRKFLGSRETPLLAPCEAVQELLGHSNGAPGRALCRWQPLRDFPVTWRL